MKFSTNVHLSESSNDRFQLLYTNQTYGTFFGIFGKFKINNDQIISVKFKLLNFKGILNIGLNHVKYLGKEIEEIDNNYEASGTDLIPTTKLNCIGFDFTIQALSGNNQFPIKETEEMPINIGLISLKDHFISIRRKIIPLEGESKFPQPTKHVVGHVFDSEFFYRDGERSPLRYTLNHIEYRQGRPKYEKSGIPKGTGGICPRGYAKILF